jgi:phosphoesterase RecJ-like protein
LSSVNFADVDWQPLIQALQAAESIVLTTHRTPDADGIGSQIALYHVLKAAGKEVAMCNRDVVPRICRFLDGADAIRVGECHTRPHDARLIISLDAGARSRLGMPDAFFDGATLINIDHHASNTRYGDINMVDARYCATGAMVFDFIRAFGATLNAAAAEAIYAAVLTDTASFRLTTVTPEVHRMVAELIEAGAQPAEVAASVYGSQRACRFVLLRHALETLELHDHGRSAWLHVDASMYAESGGDAEDTEGFIDYARSIEGVRIAVFLRPEGEGGWKASFRGRKGADVGQLATDLGGGGHRYAAGCSLTGSLDEVYQRVRAAVAAMLA